MTKSEIEYVDGEITVVEDEPSTLQELIDMIGEEACVDNINANLRYRNKYPRVYRKSSAALETAYPRAQKVVKGVPVTKTIKGKNGEPDTEEPVLVDPIEHLRQIIARGVDDEGVDHKAKVNTTLSGFALSEPLYVKGERSGAGAKISQKALDAANAKFAAGEEAVAKAVSVIESAVPGYKVGVDGEGLVTIESLARGISALGKFLAEKAAAEQKALLG